MLEKMLKFIEKHSLFTKDDKILLAMSAGMDSTALFHILHSLGYNIAIAHVNFQLRGADSDKDESFIIALAKEFNCACFTQRFDTRAYCIQKAISIQTGARKLRYNWFEELHQQQGFHYIITAHHLNDDIETALHHFSRGSGITGLKAMLPKRNLIVRPLLETSRADLVAYIQQNNISYREDKSNQDVKYTRNALRHQIIPHLEALYPHFTKSSAKSLHFLKANWHFFKEMMERETDAICTHLNDQVLIDKKLLSDHAHAELLLHEILSKYGFHSDIAQEVLSQLSTHSGQVFHSKKYELHNEREQLLLVPNRISSNDILHISESGLYTHISGELKIELAHHTADAVQPPWHIQANLSTLDFPLVLRKWRDGDRFQPKGMHGASKKIKKYLTDEKCAHHLKKEQLVLTTVSNQIIWLLGYRQDHRFTAKSSSRISYEISWKSRLPLTQLVH